jgi:cobyrinic acid a,c-diamide synthase
MQVTPRLALGALEAAVDPQPVVWALCDVLERCGLHVQTFASQARFAAHDGATVITGQRRRHLDSWLMSPDVCRELFQHGSRACDVAVVEGLYDVGRTQQGRTQTDRGGSLDTLCDWLNMPRLAVLDAVRLRHGFGSQRPEKLDGVLIDNVADCAEACRLRTTVETLWGVPVLGMLEKAPAVRAVIGGLQRGCAPSRELCRALGQRLESRLKLDRLVQLASSRRMPSEASRLFEQGPSPRPLNIAVAFDQVFQCYFPDTLDLLEARGAVLRDFSPLRDDRLPQQTDMVYFGCGLPEHHAQALAANHCMKQSIRTFARAEGRIFAECGGLAYLCEQLEMADGRRLPMAGVIPATARVNPAPQTPRPVTATLADDCWLGDAGTPLRGYLNTNYSLETENHLAGRLLEPQHRTDIVGEGNVLASRIHLDFVAHAELLDRFFQPSPQLSAAW